MHGYHCEKCGASLDTGERCTCESTKQDKRMVTMEDWYAAGSFCDIAKPGDLVEEKIVDCFMNAVPPAVLERGYLQVGEPSSSQPYPGTDIFKPTYPTFKKDDEGNWRYCGACFLGWSTAPEKI